MHHYIKIILKILKHENIQSTGEMLPKTQEEQIQELQDYSYFCVAAVVTAQR